MKESIKKLIRSVGNQNMLKFKEQLSGILRGKLMDAISVQRKNVYSQMFK